MIKLYTIGFTGKSAEKFFNLLRNSAVKKIVDTRIEYNGFVYDLPITDPFFFQKYQQNAQFMEELTEIYITLSLGIKFEMTNRYYKLVAGII